MKRQTQYFFSKTPRWIPVAAQLLRRPEGSGFWQQKVWFLPSGMLPCEAGAAGLLLAPLRSPRLNCSTPTTGESCTATALL